MTTTHQATAEEKEAFEFGQSVILNRYACSCGWKGCWYQAHRDDLLMASIQRHIDATIVRNPPTRQTRLDGEADGGS